MSFMGNFQKFVEQRLAEALAQQGRAPSPIVPQTGDLRFYEQNVNLPAPARALPSPHQPNLAGVTPNQADVSALARMLGMAQQQPQKQVQPASALPVPPPPAPGPAVRPPDRAVPGLDLGLAPFQRGQADEQAINRAKLAQQEVEQAQQEEVAAEQAAAVDQKALAKLVNGAVALGADRKAATQVATEALAARESAQGSVVTADQVDELMVNGVYLNSTAVEIQSNTYDTGVAGDVVPDVGGAVAGVGMDAIDYPRTMSAQEVAQGMRAVANGEDPPLIWEKGPLGGLMPSLPGMDAIDDVIAQTGLSPTDLFMEFASDPANQAAINSAYEIGYQAKDKYGNVIAEFEPGDRAVWELFASQLTSAQKAVVDTFIDPLNWTPIAGVASRGVKGTSKLARVGFLEAEDAGRVAARKADEAVAAGDEVAAAEARAEGAAAKEAARQAEREAAALNVVATVLRGIDLPNEIIDRAVGGVFDLIRRGTSKIPVADRQAVADAAEEVQGGRQALVRARAEEAADVLQPEVTEQTAETVPPSRGFGRGGIGPALQPDVGAVDAIPVPEPPVAAAAQPAYTPGDFGISGAPTEASPRQPGFAPSEPPPGARPLPTGERPPLQSALGDAQPSPQQAASRPAAGELEGPYNDAPRSRDGRYRPTDFYVNTGEAQIVNGREIVPVGDGGTVRMRQRQNYRWDVEELRDGEWVAVSTDKSRSGAARDATLARQRQLADRANTGGVTSPPAPQQAAPQPSPAPVVETSPVIIDDAKGIVTFEGVDDLRVKRTGQGSRERWAVQESKGGRWINTSEKLREQSEAIAQGRQSVLARQADAIDETPIPGVDETSVLAREEAPPAAELSLTTRPRPMRPHDVLPPDYQYPPKVDGKSVGGKRDLNREQRRAAMLSMTDRFVMPKEDLDYLDPVYAKADPDTVPTFAEQVAAEYGPRNPAAAEAFWDEYAPQARRYIDEDKRLARKSGGKTPEARETPERELHRVEFEARRESLFRKHFGGDEMPVRESRYETDLPSIPPGNKKQMAASGDAPDDLRAIVEQAVFGEDDVATRARGYLHAAANNPAINRALGENPSTVANRLSNLRKEIMGEEALSQSTYARRQRKKAAKADISPDATGITATAAADPRARSLYRRTLRAMQPEVEEAIDPGFVDEVTEADSLYNAGHFEDDKRVWFNQEVNAPQVKKSDEGTWYDAGWVSNKRATTFKAGESKRVGVIQPAEGVEAQRTLGDRALGRTTVLDAIDDLVAQGVDDETINTMVGRLIAEARGVNVANAIKEASRFGKAFNGWNRFVRENTQFWIGRVLAGWFQDAVSDGWAGVVNGIPGVGVRQLDPHLNRLVFQSVQGSNTADAMLKQHEVFRYITDLGDDVPVELSALGQGRVDAPLSGETIAGKYLNFNVRGHRVGPGGLVASKWARDLRTTGDRVRRFLAFDHSLRAEMRDAAGRFDVLLGRQAERRGVPVADWHRAINDVMGDKVAFSPNDLRRAIPGGDGEMLARAWRGEIKRARNKARAKVEKMYFSYRQTKADEIIRHATFFHYWMTRATAMHAEMALRNPWLAATYYRMWEGLKNNAQREGYPDTLNSYIRFMGESMFGAHAYVDALSFIVPFTMFREVSSEYAQPWEKVGLFLNPMAEGILGVIGISENIPNLLGTAGLERRVAAVLDHMEADGIGDGQPVETWTRRVGEMIVEGANDVLRGVGVPGVRDFQPFDPNMYYRDQMIHLIEFRAEQEYGPREGWTPEQQTEVDAAKDLVGLDARKNPLSAWAHDQWAEQSLWGQAFAWLAPVRIRTAVRDENAVLADQGMDAIVDDDPTTQPTPEQQAALDIGAQAKSGDPVLTSLDQRYRAIGTTEQQDQASIYNDIAYGTPEEVAATLAKWVLIMPPDLSVEGITALDDDGRRAEADRVMAWLGGTEEREQYVAERDAFREGNPEYAQYNDWSRQMFDYPGGALAAAEAMRKISPNFEAYVREQESFGELTEGDVTGVKAFLAQQGEQWSVYTPAKEATDISAVPASNFLFGGSGGSGSGSGEKKPKMTDAEKQAERITEDVAEYESFLAIADQYVASISNGIPYNRLERNSKASVDKQLRAAGLKPPSTSEDAHLYMLWRSAQPAGSDTSVEAFVIYMEGIKTANAEAIGVDPKAIEAVGDAGEKDEDD